MSTIEQWVKHGDEMRRPLLVHPKLGDSQTVIIVGGGLSGMCCAYQIAIKRPDVNVVVIEQSNRLGGVITTWQDGEWICDLAVNATRPHPAFWRLIDELDLATQFRPSRHEAKSRWVLINGKPHRLSWRTMFKIGPLRLYKSIRQSRRGGSSVAELIPNTSIADALCLGIVNDTASNVDADFLMPSITKYGRNPPIKKSKLKKLISESYPIFTPRTGSIASIDGGMQSLIARLSEKLTALDNVQIILNQAVQSPESVADSHGVDLKSVIWAAPGFQKNYTESKLSIFAVGYRKNQVDSVPIGYGTLIPDRNIPVSGILHESDLHQSKRCPDGRRLFRLMVPHSRWDGDEQSILTCAESLLAEQPELFAKIGERRIPQYPPGYMDEIAQMNYDCSYVGWSVSGVSITHVVDEAERVAELF